MTSSSLYAAGVRQDIFANTTPLAHSEIMPSKAPQGL